MIGRYDAAINSTWLSEIDDRIVVVDVLDGAPKTRVVTSSAPSALGTRYIRTLRENLSVTIQFAIWEQDVELRKELLMRIQCWAADAINGVARLEISDRRRQQLYVRASEIPSIGSAAWTGKLSMVFTAYEMPYWMDIEYVKTETAESGALFVPGLGEAFCEAEATNTGMDPVTALILSVGGTSFAFSGLNLAPGEKLIVSYDHFARVSARIGETSVLANRTPESDDDLIALCGAYNQVAVSSDGSVSAVFKARGVYL